MPRLRMKKDLEAFVGIGGISLMVGSVAALTMTFSGELAMFVLGALAFVGAIYNSD